MKESLKKTLPRWLLITAVLLLSIQIIAVTIYVYSFIPLVWDDSFLKGLEPTRDTLFYAIFIAATVILTALGVKLILPQLDSPDTWRKFKFWLCLESVWCFLMLFCFFKWTTYRYTFWNVLPYENHGWLAPFFCAVCAMAVLSKVFFPEIEALYRRLQASGGQCSRSYTIGLQVLFIAGVVLLLYIPSTQDVTALAFSWDQWNHLDAVVGWFIKHGWYVSYDQTIQMLVLAAIAYIIGLFYFIRLWLNSWLLAAIGALLAVKMGMFYYGIAPCVWTNPANTFLAHGWDIFLFFGLWYIALQHPQKFYPAAALAGVVLVLGWFKSNGYIEALGLDNQPMMAPLRVRQFFPFFMGFFVPLFYVFSLLLLMGQKKDQNASQPLFIRVLCIYGLMIFIDYLEHPMIGYYGSLMVPAILIMLWWLDQLCLSSKAFVRRSIYAGIILLVAGALMTNRLMVIYPNCIFQDKERFARERAFYEKNDAFTSSAAVIGQLTTENQKVALLSNFETVLLMKAHRQPLFKDFPVMLSGFTDEPGGLRLKTKKQGLDLISRLTEENALYVFVDQRLLALSPNLGDSGLKAILSYLDAHYAFYTRQGFLAVLQRR